MSKKILIVEDEKPIAKALNLKLSSEGFDVTLASDGEAALSLISSGDFDLILLDLVMPKLDGFGVLVRLQDSGNSIPVIVTSNLSQLEDLDKAKELGAVGYYVKSNTPLSELVTIINKYLN